jgi:hypothetical protein
VIADYGVRVGIWHTIDILDRHGIRASVLAELRSRRPLRPDHQSRPEPQLGLAPGQANSILQAGMSLDEERRVLTDVIDTAAATGQRPRGWMGPGLTGTLNTPALLAEFGLRYVLDWTNDDQPYRLNVPSMISIPYSVDHNDLLVFGKGTTGPEFMQIVNDQYEQLHAESRHSSRVIALALYPFVIGQPFRAKYWTRC